MKTILLLAALGLAIAGPALAQPNVYNGGSANYRPNEALGSSQDVQSSVSSLAKQFSKIDTSHNGLATRSEWGAAGLFARDFSTLDADNDGRVSLAEWEAGLQGRSNHKDDQVAAKKK